MDFNKQALVLRIGLGLRRYTRSDISDWVTNQITSRDHVEEPLVELGTLVGKTEQDITRLLNLLSGPLPDGMAARIEMAMVARMVETGQLELGTALKHVASLAHEGLTPEERSHVLELDAQVVHLGEVDLKPAQSVGP